LSARRERDGRVIGVRRERLFRGESSRSQKQRKGELSYGGGGNSREGVFTEEKREKHILLKRGLWGGERDHDRLLQREKEGDLGKHIWRPAAFAE